MTLFGIEIHSPFQSHTKPFAWKKYAARKEQATLLAQIPAGRWAVVSKFLPGMPAERCAQLRAYGLMPGCQVFILQHTPVTVIRIDHLELALENSLVKEIQVGPLE
jgi:Fe2+ transport system protein FeoA